jgi:hypothetical protein
MSDLERRLEQALKAIDVKGRKLVKKLAKEAQTAQDRLVAAQKLLKEREAAVYHARFKHAEALKQVTDTEKQEKLKGRIEYNFKVRNR